MIEEFKSIPGFKNYEVSNKGNVKSLNYKRTQEEKILKLNLNEKGYLRVVLINDDNIKKNIKVHQLVAMAFLNHIPNGTHNIVVDHINNIKTDNNLENLQLISNRENVIKNIENKTSKYTGVSWSKSVNKWVSTIYLNKKLKYLGSFENEETAHNAYVKALNDYENLVYREP